MKTNYVDSMLVMSTNWSLGVQQEKIFGDPWPGHSSLCSP